MSNIQVRRHNGRVSRANGTWTPFSLASAFAGWDPFEEVSKAFAQPVTTGAERTGFAPAFDIKETKEAFEFRADVPGVRQTDLEIELTGNRLTIAGHRDDDRSQPAATNDSPDNSAEAREVTTDKGENQSDKPVVVESPDATARYFTWERRHGAFKRVFTLPNGISGEAVKADLKDGVLTLVVPKTPEHQPRQIPVNVS